MEPPSWYELYEQNDKLEGMIHIYQQEIETLELENSKLKEKITFLKKKLSYGNLTPRSIEDKR
tara:strand:- start:757 stop:945 length:189 start_codon:yes stop_codon:yes gene_type:complete